jgi:hypothetical protein
MSGVPSVQWLFARANGQLCDQRPPRQPGNGREGHQTCPMCHRTVWCPPENERNQSDDLVVVADRVSDVPPDCAVHPRTEGNQRLLNGTSTAPRPLRAIKGPLDAWSRTPSILWAHYNSKTLWPRLWSVWERFERIFWFVTPSLCCCALFFIFVRIVVALCSCVRILLPPLL